MLFTTIKFRFMHFLKALNDRFYSVSVLNKSFYKENVQDYPRLDQISIFGQVFVLYTFHFQQVSLFTHVQEVMIHDMQVDWEWKFWYGNIAHDIHLNLVPQISTKLFTEAAPQVETTALVYSGGCVLQSPVVFELSNKMRYAEN